MASIHHRVGETPNPGSLDDSETKLITPQYLGFVGSRELARAARDKRLHVDSVVMRDDRTYDFELPKWKFLTSGWKITPQEEIAGPLPATLVLDYTGGLVWVCADSIREDRGRTLRPYVSTIVYFDDEGQAPDPWSANSPWHNTTVGHVIDSALVGFASEHEIATSHIL